MYLFLEAGVVGGVLGLLLFPVSIGVLLVYGRRPGTVRGLLTAPRTGTGFGYKARRRRVSVRMTARECFARAHKELHFFPPNSNSIYIAAKQLSSGSALQSQGHEPWA